MTSSLDGGSLQFINHEFTLWDKSFGDPHRQPNMSLSESPSKGNFDGKFIGKCSLPFSFPFPTHVDLLTKSAILPTINSSSPTSPHRYELSPIDMSPPSSPDATPEKAKGKKKRRSSWTFGFMSGSAEANESSSSCDHQPSKPSYRISHQTANWTALRTTASPIPQTFMERGVTASVGYEISALFVHGRFKSDKRRVLCRPKNRRRAEFS